MRALALLALFATYMPTVFIQPFCGVLLWTWFSIMNPHRIVWGFASELPYTMIIAVGTAVALLMSREPKVPPRSIATFAFIAMMISYSISTAMALSPLATPIWDRVMKELLFSVFTLMLLTNKTRIHALIWVLVLSIGYFGLKGGVFTLMTGGAHRIYGPPFSYIEDNNHLAVALVMILPLMNYLRMHSSNRLVVIGMTAVMVFTAIAAIFTFSRGGFLALLGGGAVMWWRSRRKLAITVLAVAGAVVLLQAAPDQLWERWQTIETYEDDASAQARFSIWRDGLKVVAGNPVFGGGFRATYDWAVMARFDDVAAARAVHNSHLEILIENGAIGFALHLLLIGTTWLQGAAVMRAARRRPGLAWAYDLAAMVQTSLFAYVTGGMFVSLGYYDGWYSLPVLMTGLHLLVRKEIRADRARERAPAVRAEAAGIVPVRP